DVRLYESGERLVPRYPVRALVAIDGSLRRRDVLPGDLVEGLVGPRCNPTAVGSALDPNPLLHEVAVLVEWGQISGSRFVADLHHSHPHGRVVGAVADRAGDEPRGEAHGDRRDGAANHEGCPRLAGPPGATDALKAHVPPPRRRKFAACDPFR